MSKLQSPSKYSPFDAIHLSRWLTTAQNSFWTHWFWCLLVLLLFFCFTFSTWGGGEDFLFRKFFIWGDKKKAAWGEIGRIDRVGYRGHAVFGQNCCGHRCAGKSPIMKWTNALKKSVNKLHWSWMQPLTTTPVVPQMKMGS